ncbi:MAG: helix-turn-helix transcriptional regulator [Rhodospirillaceae bacterium]|jgi:DNA-binding HxlR family transcriptional regulator|nr:helix-turn-helix transcriptional regulator [Rhodospirillales bacterium]MBT3907530.1 helix-turn-helix transcriptional regulator [Rhodospirillaceae bacterium]MBT4700975.1 helix-turn-helix transcriptional regulator [Rhodospirillaceae bacterium]MBT5036826.1 helix-turn-helix transcriptional regulator [Rhodospirillaceae bacterium]MBT6219130.1 helix-turn-helix transcriptional regulator [Rhodospirillaceae bacterium]
MTSYGQFCPVAKATEIVGDKWTMLILRELLMGTTRFNDFQHSMSRISPTVLNKRLKMLEAKGVIIRRRQSGLRGHEYRLTAMGKELEPVVENLAIWGMRWARGQMSDDELDVELLMWDIRRRIDADNLPDGETVLCFTFTDLEHYKTWWLVFSEDDVDLCTEDTGKDVDLYVSSELRTMIEVWEGDRSLKSALDEERITAIGSQHLIRNMKDWFSLCSVADIRPAVPR